MKTNELIKKLEKIDGVKIYHQDFISLSMNGIKIATVGKIGQWLDIETNCPDEVAKLLFDYYLTPLEEREEEKKYRLKLPNGFESMLGEDYVCLTSDKVRERYVITAKETYHGFRNIFTQKEIDAMPFDTNFFIKEEVL